MGTLTAQASTNNGGTWSNIFTISGNQGTAWASASVDLAGYVGGTVKLRFVGTTGTNYTSDMAIDNISLTTGSGGGGATTTTVTLTLVLDQYATETAWTLKNSSGATVASGSGYTVANSTVNETFNLPAGCYDFAITDSYGDGICCTYGNGSYTLSNGGTTLATGGAYGSGETKNFCVGGATSNIPVLNNEFSKLSDSFSFEAFPNPATSQISIRITGADQADFSIVDVTGKTMKSGKIIDGQIGVSLHGLTRGVYIIKASSKGKTLTKKFVKQ